MATPASAGKSALSALSLATKECEMTTPATVDESLITAEGYELLRAELERLRTDGRTELSMRLHQVRQDGHLGDNWALVDAFEEQAQLETRIATLERQLAAARIAEPTDDGCAGVGSRVRVRHLDDDQVVDYELVGAIDPRIGDGCVSVKAPVGQALVGRRAGALVAVSAPRGSLALEIVSVRSSSLRRAA
jgi:transcription elongation factor GreA